MLNKKAIFGIAVLLLAVSFSFFTGSSYAGKASAPIPSSETVNLNKTVTFYFDANGVSQQYVQIQVCVKSLGFDVDQLPYEVSNITSPHTSSIALDPGTYEWRMRNTNTGEISSTVREFVVQQ